MDRVLFVCSNGLRSRMAVRTIRRHAPKRFVAFAAWTQPRKLDEPLPKIGWYTQSNWPGELERGDFRYLIVLEEGITPPSLPGIQNVLLWPFPAPENVPSWKIPRLLSDELEGTIFDWLTKFEESEPLDADVVPPHHLEQQAERARGV